MKGFILFVVLLIVLFAGGALTAQLTANQGAGVLPILEVTSSPDASRTVMQPWKAEQFFLMIGFILFNLIGIAATLALLFWLADRGIRRSKADAAAGAATTTQVTATE